MAYMNLSAAGYGAGTMVFLDANAGEIIRPAAMAAMGEAWGFAGNPSSVHAAGRQARAALEQARVKIAQNLGADSRYLVFTSGGTEADALAIHALGAGRRILIGATEHDAIRAAAPEATIIPVDQRGVARLEWLESALREGPSAFVALMLANNETGVIHPIAEAAAICRAHGAWLHVDAVQALGRVKIDLPALGADSLALSAHKAGGPKAIGALVMARDFAARALIKGGGQEKGWRGGTHNLPGAMGFAAVADLPPSAAHPAWCETIAAAAIDAGALIAGEGAATLPNTLCLILPGVRADTQLINLDLAGFAVSAGAACSSGKVAKSHVLSAMGLEDHAGSAIRVSLSWKTTQEEVESFIAAYTAMARRLKR